MRVRRKLKSASLVMAAVMAFTVVQASAFSAYAQDCPNNWRMELPTLIFDTSGLPSGASKGLGFRFTLTQSTNNPIARILEDKKSQLGGDLLYLAYFQASVDQQKWENYLPFPTNYTNPNVFSGSEDFFRSQEALWGYSKPFNSVKLSYKIEVKGCVPLILETTAFALPKVPSAGVGIDAAHEDMTKRNILDFKAAAAIKTSYLAAKVKLESSDFGRPTSYPISLDGSVLGQFPIRYADPGHCFILTESDQASISGSSCSVGLILGGFWVVDVLTLRATSTPSNSIKQGAKMTISCVKGKIVKSVTGTSPQCPKGYKKR